jgi:serine/threonine-protein phosphatase 2A regulatory subunit A
MIYISGKKKKVIKSDLVDDDDDVLLALADSLGSFLEFVGGPKYAMHVLSQLETLCNVEESVVRDKVLGVTRLLGNRKH